MIMALTLTALVQTTTGTTAPRGDIEATRYAARGTMSTASPAVASFPTTRHLDMTTSFSTTVATNTTPRGTTA